MNIRYLNTIFFFAILGATTWGVYQLFAPFVSAIFMAVIFAILFYPAYEYCVRHFGGRTYLAATTMLAVVALTIIVPLIGVSTLVIGEVTDTAQAIVVNEETVGIFEEKVRGVIAVVPGAEAYLSISQETLTNGAQQAGAFLVKLAQKTYAGVVGSIIGIFVLFFTLFYLFIDGRVLMRKIMFLSPLSDKHERLLFESFSAMSRATIKGTLIIGLIQGSLGAIAFWIVGVPNTIIWWVLMVFLATIPLLGVGIIGFPFAVYYFIIGNVFAGTLLLVSFVFISLFDNYLRPLIVGHDVQMHTLLVFFATLGGIMAFGLIGFVVGPIIMALFVTLWHIYALEFAEELTEYNRASESS